MLNKQHIFGFDFWQCTTYCIYSSIMRKIVYQKHQRKVRCTL